MPEDYKVKYHELIHAELDRAVRSIIAQSVKICQIVSKISQILLKLDCLPLEQTKCPNETSLCHYKISDAIYHMVNIVEKYDKIKQDIRLQHEFDSNETFEEYISLSTMRIDYLKTIARRMTAMSENITRIYGEMGQDDDNDDDEEGTTESESTDELEGSFTNGTNNATVQ